MGIYSEICQLNARFAWLIDHRSGEGVPQLFIEDGWYGNAQQKVSGRAEIESFYKLRKARGNRVSRHIFSPPVLHEVSAEKVVSTAMMTLFAQDGDGPHPAHVHLVMDYNDTCVLEDGLWRYKSREMAIVFGTPDLRLSSR